MNLNRILDLLADLRLKVEDIAHDLLMIWYRVVDALEPRIIDLLDRLKPLADRVRPHILIVASGLILSIAGGILIYSFQDILPADDNNLVQQSVPSPEPLNESSRLEDVADASTDIGASASASASASADSNLIQRFTVLAIDAGHGGVDPGSIAKNGLMEKEVTLILAKAVRKKLETVDNLHVALTRYDDRTINIDSRTEIIEEIGADFVLSLHLNSIPQEHIALVESYYKKIRRADPRKQEFFVKSSDDNVQESRALATAVQDSVFETVKRHNKISVNAGLKTDSMRILSQNAAPGVLIEVTCLSNPDEAERLMTDTYIDKLSQSIADGVVKFLDQRNSSLTAGI